MRLKMMRLKMLNKLPQEVQVRFENWVALSGAASLEHLAAKSFAKAKGHLKSAGAASHDS